MAKFQTKAFTQQKPMYLPDDAGSEDSAILIEFPSVALAVGDLIEVCEIPVGYKCLDWTFAPDDIDTNGAPTLAFSLGVENAGGTDLGAEVWGTGLTGAQTGSVNRASTSAAALGDSTVARKIALKVTAAAATYAGAGKTGYLILKLQG